MIVFNFFFAFDKLHGLLKTLNLWYFGVDIKKTIYDKIRLVVRSYPKKVPFFFSCLPSTPYRLFVDFLNVGVGFTTNYGRVCTYFKYAVDFLIGM